MFGIYIWFYVSLLVVGLFLFLNKLHDEDEKHRTGKSFGETFPIASWVVLGNFLASGLTMGIAILCISQG